MMTELFHRLCLVHLVFRGGWRLGVGSGGVCVVVVENNQLSLNIGEKNYYT